MSAAHNGGPAFPTANGGSPDDGMTLRDYFAAKAMAAMVAKSDGQSKTAGAKGVWLIAQYAYEFADAMLLERAK